MLNTLLKWIPSLWDCVEMCLGIRMNQMAYFESLFDLYQFVIDEFLIYNETEVNAQIH